MKASLMRPIPPDTTRFRVSTRLFSESPGCIYAYTHARARTHICTHTGATRQWHTGPRRLKLRRKGSARFPMTVMITFAVKGRQSNFEKTRLLARLSHKANRWNTPSSRNPTERDFVRGFSKTTGDRVYRAREGKSHDARVSEQLCVAQTANANDPVRLVGRLVDRSLGTVCCAGGFRVSRCIPPPRQGLITFR